MARHSPEWWAEFRRKRIERLREAHREAAPRFAAQWSEYVAASEAAEQDKESETTE